MDFLLRHEIDRLWSRVGEEAVASANDFLVDYLETRNFLRDPRLLSAMRKQPRHLFLPANDPREVYQDRAITTASDERGWYDSSCSTPSIVALMLEELNLPGAKSILEIGAGTGWTAALMSSAAPEAEITTLEILEEIAAGSRARLAGMGLDRIDLRCVDGSPESAGSGPYDRIVFACGAAHIPQGFIDLLAGGGRMVVPVGHFLHVFDLVEDRLHGHPFALASFISYDEGKPTRRWHVEGDRGLLLGDELEAHASELALDRAEVVAGPELDSDRVATLLYWLSFEEPSRHFVSANRNGGWSMGCVAPDGRSAAALEFAGEYTFRHYPDQVEQAQLLVWGGDEAGGRLLEICERVAELGWPKLHELDVCVHERTAGGDLAVPVGEHLWSVKAQRPVCF